VDEVTKNKQCKVSWYIMFSDYMDEWRLALEGKESRMSRSKIKYIEHYFVRRNQEIDRTRRAMTINGEVRVKLRALSF